MRAPAGAARVLATVLVAAGTCACAKELPPLPLRPEPVPWADTLPIPEPDEQEEQRPLRVLTVQAPYDISEPFRVGEGEALNRTHMDDVVSSAWWERRMGYRDISPAELARGSAPPQDAPATDGTLTVKGAKIGGVTAGFVMEDAKGDTYIVKFDHPGWPYLQSSVGVVVNRLMWGAGYWVPADYVATLDAADLTVGEDVTVEEGGGERPMTMDDVRAVLESARPLPDGRYRFLASKFVPGTPKGPFFLGGTRKDDPNDHFRHEHRRELRGLRMISAWLNNTDAREGNTLDVYIDPPGYLRHYLIDFAAALGSSTDRAKHPKDDVERPADFWRGVKRVASLGFYREGWEDDPHPATPVLGFIKAETFDPDEWKSAWDNPAFFAMTEADGYWAAKIVGSFTDEHIRAAVSEGALPEPWQVDTLTQVLALRRDNVVRRYFSSVTPIEEPRVTGGGEDGFTLAFRDLGLEHDVWTPAATRYRWTLSHHARGLEARGQAPAVAGRQSLDVRWDGSSRNPGRLDGREALAVLEVLAVRDVYHMDDEDPRAATVWLRWNADTRRYRVVGLEH